MYGDTQMILRTQFGDIVKVNNIDWKILYGVISKYTVIDGKDWLNLNNMEVQNIELPSNTFPNLKDSEYIFVLNAHRLAIVSNDMNINSVEKFLLGAIKKVINEDETYEVVIEQEEDIFERIIQAESVKKLLIDISYSNADTGDEAYAFMDDQIRKSEMKRLKLEATPNHNGNIKTDQLLISGALKVAQSNGYAKATIVENGSRIKIDTKDHPKTLFIKCEETLLRLNIVTRIIEMFRPNSNGNS